jgi:hypothetical protein
MPVTKRLGYALAALLATGAMLAPLDTPVPSTRQVVGAGILAVVLWTRLFILWETSHE